MLIYGTLHSHPPKDPLLLLFGSTATLGVHDDSLSKQLPQGSQWIQLLPAMARNAILKHWITVVAPNVSDERFETSTLQRKMRFVDF